jgi:hypothetical protein
MMDFDKFDMNVEHFIAHCKYPYIRLWILCLSPFYFGCLLGGVMHHAYIDHVLLKLAYRQSILYYQNGDKCYTITAVWWRRNARSMVGPSYRHKNMDVDFIFKRMSRLLFKL